MSRLGGGTIRWAIAVVVLAAAIGVMAWIRLPRPSGDAEPVDIETLGAYGQVPEFSLVERSGRSVGLADLKGKVWIANFIYTECTATCPTQSLELSRLQREFAAEPDLRLVSITVDPEHDAPEVLARYADRYGADPVRWLFLTGAKPVIYALAKDGFKLGVVDPGDSKRSRSLLHVLEPATAYASHGSGGLIIHSPRLVLVDRQGRVRAYHRPDDPESLARLRGNVRGLLAER